MSENTAWLEISLTVEPELAEAVAEVLSRHLPDGVVIESTGVRANAEDQGQPVGPLRVAGYIPADDRLEESRAQIEQDLRYLALIQPLPQPEYRPVADQNWMESWKQHYRPLEVGRRLLVLPAWAQAPKTEREVIRIEPGMAFGTGVHPTTQLILQLMEKHLHPGHDVIDIGTGSGILAIAARRLAASHVLGVDIEQEAIANARRNAQRNQLQMELRVGSLVEVIAGKYTLSEAELVIVNILAPVLVRLLSTGLARLVKEGGTLLLSGILDEQEGAVQKALASAGMRSVERVQMGDWIGLAAQPAD